MTIDLISAASDGVFALLDAAIDPAIAEVATNPRQIEPTDTAERRFVLLGDIDSESLGGKDEQLERITVQIVVVYRGRQRSELHALMHLAREALEGARPAIAGVDFGSIDFAGASSSPPARDGVTHAGILEFEVTAEPA
ncbi:tail completion protein gp17 [Sphingomonas hengshuiensis]|uniref:DUF3168 domain-containing protein n=1 Tax=Sphingomonas hengshuiensis TaxID=1609977 RepID=A0A7U4LG90_9SPHN|nr:DUF3168 domain-containing protein [Sphingomonas hengshuiensis]AJP72929.1 hypothetical protein TS85_15715 [Sphingomonas hengshuiensis]